MSGLGEGELKFIIAFRVVMGSLILSQSISTIGMRQILLFNAMLP